MSFALLSTLLELLPGQPLFFKFVIYFMAVISILIDVTALGVFVYAVSHL